MDVWEYFLQRENEINALSLGLEKDFSDYCTAEAGTDDQRGKFLGNLILGENAFVSVSETVVVAEQGQIHREEYGYFLVIEGEEIWGYERDPSHNPAVHRHSLGHTRHDADPISFRDAIEQAWGGFSNHR